MVKEMPSSTVTNRDEECLRKSLMELVKSDSSSICRLCLSKDQKLTRVFEDESGIDDALLKKIFDCTSVKVKLKNVFPSAICAVCDLKLNEFYKFREKCIENNTILHNLLGKRDLSAEVNGSGFQWTGKGDDEETDEEDDDGGQEQQAATSTTSIVEGQQSESTVAIALNQLSELGLRTMMDLGSDGKDDAGSEAAGTIRVARNLLASTTSSGEGGRNIVSSSWSSPVQNPESSAPATNENRTYALDAMEMATTGTHLRTGAREGKYECKECHRTFRNAYTLRRHNNLHTRTNLFPCEYCGKKFNDRSNWKIHQRSHTGDNLYTCLVCLKTFISPSTLKYHLRSHRRLESFDCRVCHDTFGSYELLEAHARNLHPQHNYDMAMDDFAPDSDQHIDAARFVKIELEDGELPSPMSVDMVSDRKNEMALCQSFGGDEGDDLDDEDVRLADDGNILQCHGTNDGAAVQKDVESHQPHQTLVNHGSGSPVSHAQVAKLMEQRRQQLLEQVLQEQELTNKASVSTDEVEMKPNVQMLSAESAVAETAAVEAASATTIKQESTSDGDVTVKEEPQDDSFEMDPSELLQQAMEEADADEQDKEPLSSSSASSPSTVIMFRCDYCMKIFHYLDELNAHMVLHNGMKEANGNGALVLGTLGAVNPIIGAAVHLPLPVQVIQPQVMLKQLAVRCSNIPIRGSTEPLKSSTGALSPRIYPARKPVPILCKPSDTITNQPFGATERRRNAFEPDPADVVNAPPPEHRCSKCSKMFRTEELRRVHEETHANDELVNKVRSCQFCNKVFKCELNLLAHLRKHHSVHPSITTSEPDVVGAGSGGGGGGTGGTGDSGGTGNDESCTSMSNIANGTVAPPHPPVNAISSSNEPVSAVEHQVDGSGSISDGEGSSGTSGKSALRRCEICAISFTDTAMLEKHVLSHFERNEAVAFVPSTDRPFKCTECHKRFKRKDYLLIHIRTHTGERRYKCDLCTSAFVHPSNLITHRKLHSNERPYKCSLCNATFKLFAGLKIHRRRCEQKLPNLTMPGCSDQEDHCYRWSK